jgi:hypothetical protein
MVPQQAFVEPIVEPTGLPAGTRLDLDLLDTRRFTSGAVYLRYHPKPP